MSFTGLVPLSTQMEAPGDTDRSPRPATPTCAGCWSRPPRAIDTPGGGSDPEATEPGSIPAGPVYTWAAQVRLHRRFHTLAATKNKNVPVAAVARELAGFCWGLMTDRTEL
jgi:hypothetical protein